jgi:hypothetical protein
LDRKIIIVVISLALFAVHSRTRTTVRVCGAHRGRIIEEDYVSVSPSINQSIKLSSLA